VEKRTKKRAISFCAKMAPKTTPREHQKREKRRIVNCGVLKKKRKLFGYVEARRVATRKVFWGSKIDIFFTLHTRNKHSLSLS
jgi:hypothetical protein